MNKWKVLGLIICVVIGFLIGISLDLEDKEEKQQAIQQEIPILQEIKSTLVDACVPDSLKEASRDASYTLMYTEADGNDYWSSRSTIHQTEAYIKTCVPCMYIDSLLQAKEQELKELQE